MGVVSWLVPLASGGGGAAVLGGAVALLRWLGEARKRRDSGLLAAAQAREADAMAQQALAEAGLKRIQQQREQLLANGDVLGLLKSYMRSFAAQEQQIATLTTDLAVRDTTITACETTIEQLRAEIAVVRDELALVRRQLDVQRAAPP